MGLEWVWGLLQPGFVRWAPPASQKHFNHWLSLSQNLVLHECYCRDANHYDLGV